MIFVCEYNSRGRKVLVALQMRNSSSLAKWAGIELKPPSFVAATIIATPNYALYYILL